MNPNDIHRVYPGDRVIVNQAFYNPERHLNGQTGVVDRKVADSSRVIVRLESGQEVSSAHVTKVAPPEAPVTLLLDNKRLQAVQAAKAILGDATVQEIRELAEFLLEGKPEEPKEPLAERAKAGGLDPAAEALQASMDASATASDFWLSEVRLSYDGVGGDVLQTPGGYVKRHDVVALIEFAQAALRHFDRQQTPATPF